MLSFLKTATEAHCPGHRGQWEMSADLVKERLGCWRVIELSHDSTVSGRDRGRRQSLWFSLQCSSHCSMHFPNEILVQHKKGNDHIISVGIMLSMTSRAVIGY